MTKKEIKAIETKKIRRLFEILETGKFIAIATFDKNNEYWLLNDTVWYLPRRQDSINCGTLKEFTAQVLSNQIKAKFV